MKSNKGITLVVLVITIIVILILSGTAIFVSYDTIQKAAEQRFINHLKQIQEAVIMHKNDFTTLNLSQINETINGVSYKYKIETKDEYEKIGLTDITDIVYVNFESGQVYSTSGINGKHTLQEFGITEYVPEQHNVEESSNLDFNIILEPQQYSWNYIVKNEDINYNGNVQKCNLLYTEYNKNEWKRVNRTENGFKLEIKTPGIYELKFRDETGQESEIKQVYAYVKDGLQLYYDGEYNENYKHNESVTTWTDLSGNGNDGQISGGRWNTNYLILDGENDFIKTKNKIEYNKNQVTIDYTDIDGALDKNTGIAILFESSEDWNSNNTGFGVDLNKCDTKALCFIFHSDDYNIKVTQSYIVDNSIFNNYIFQLDTQETYNNFHKMYKNNELIELKVFNNYNYDISNTKLQGYNMYIGSRAGTSTFAKMNIGTFKIYNRVLTDQEIKTNYEIDKIRFNK